MRADQRFKNSEITQDGKEYKKSELKSKKLGYSLMWNQGNP